MGENIRIIPMKKFWQSKTHWFTVVVLPMLSYALLNINELGFSPETAGWLGIGLTGATMAGYGYLRQVTETGIG